MASERLQDVSGTQSVTRCVRGRARAAAPAGRAGERATAQGAEVVDPDLLRLDEAEATLVAYLGAFRSSRAASLLELLDEPRRELLQQSASAVAARERPRRLELLGRILAPAWTEGSTRRLALALGEEPAWLRTLVLPLTPRMETRGGTTPPARARPHPALSALARRFVLGLLGG